jgi:hypothetical protein
LLYAGTEQQTLTNEFLSATPDGLVVDQPADALAYVGVPDLGPGRCFVTEIKSIDPRTSLTAPKPEHAYQAIVQQGLFRELTEHQPEYAVVLYVNASFLDDIVEFVVPFDSDIYEHAKQRAARVMTARSALELRPEGWIAGGAECGYCPYTKACGRERVRVPNFDSGPVDAPFVAEVAHLAQAIKTLETEADNVNACLRGAQEDLKERLRARQLRRVVADGLSILWSPVKGRPSYDNARIREAAAQAGIDLATYETVGDATDRLTIRLASTLRTKAS